ncbi:metallophosphoesterase [Oceanicoccus sagamiensis]|uniref:Calcineurin-like phosphoesterase domain-containing protein n=1 Tax=Oceanicoccus sagamiensis TaxID=716816 RepID=A0A1X9NFX7_9GAMM|nr:metallophosphoesterase [Oceanicoccus sagamiensis]ARN74775.1 hypothetical protein BST96_11985 [Oceanicoccus sagamiensis]
MRLKVTGLCLIVLLSACSTNKPANTSPYINAELAQVSPQTAPLKQRILLLGDAGHSAIDPLQPSLEKAINRATLAPEKTTVVMLGDNIYFFGFPNKDEDEQYSASQLEDISHLEAQLQIAKRSGAEMYIVPGNHDWYADQVDSQAQYIEDYARDNQLQAEFAPHRVNADPLPEIIHRDGISIVFLDSQWLIKAEETSYQQAIEHLEQLLQTTARDYPDNLLLLTAHHPMETMGPHNGYYTHRGYQFAMFMLELFRENDQDIEHPRYQRMINDMERLLADKKSVFAAGHDHSLQVFKDPEGNGPQYRLVSGAANTSKVSGVGTSDTTDFALSQEGFMELDILANGILLKVYDIYNEQPVHQQWLWQPE